MEPSLGSKEGGVTYLARSLGVFLDLFGGDDVI